MEETRKGWARVHRMATVCQRWDQAEAIRTTIDIDDGEPNMYRIHVFCCLVYVTYENYDEGKIEPRSTKVDEIATGDFIDRLRRFRNHWFHYQPDMFIPKYYEFLDPKIDGLQKTFDLHFALRDHFSVIYEWAKMRTVAAYEAEGVSEKALEEITNEQYNALPQWFKDRSKK